MGAFAILPTAIAGPLHQPFAGLLKISVAPMRHAIAEVNQ